VAMAAILRMSTNPAFDLSADLARITAATLVIGWTHDGIRTPAMVTKVAAHIPGAKYVEARSGHFMAVETPDLFVELAGAVPDGRSGGGEVIVAVPDAE
jgi:3-oxoadipate enol-lactonase